MRTRGAVRAVWGCSWLFGLLGLCAHTDRGHPPFMVLAPPCRHFSASAAFFCVVCALSALRLRLHLIWAVGGVRPVGTPASAAFDLGCVLSALRLRLCVLSALRRNRLRSRQPAQPKPTQPPDRSPNQMQPKPTQPPDRTPPTAQIKCSRSLRSRQTAHYAEKSCLRCKEPARRS